MRDALAMLELRVEVYPPKDTNTLKISKFPVKMRCVA